MINSRSDVTNDITSSIFKFGKEAHPVITAKVRYPLSLAILSILCLWLAACKCNCSPSRIIVGSRPPKLLSPGDVIANLSKIPPPRVSGFDRFVGFFTIAFKRVGVFGWADMNYEALACGKVIGCEYSTDGFLTVDLRLNEISFEGQSYKTNDSVYLRAEVCLRKITISRRPKVDEQIAISGRLMWDGDGFLEVHPTKPSDITEVCN
jgi:hypothetical protein